jgi:glycosyltransferase involved in cell wall biosynthesis
MSVRRTDSAHERRVLMICCAFPPTGGPGVQRSVKFAKYLPQFGWHPYVWSAKQIAGLPADATLLRDLPATVTRRWLKHTEWDRAIRQAGERAASRLGPDGRWGRAVAGLGWRTERGLRGLLDRLVPDEFVAWALRSYGPVCRWARRERIEALYSTFSPPSNHLLASLVQRTLGVPWIADYRDLWTDNYDYHCPRAWQHKLNLRLDNRFLRLADAVVSVSDQCTAALAAHRPASEQSRFHTITNGVDLDDFDAASRSTAPEPTSFRLTFVGHCIRMRFPTVVQEGISRFVAWARADGLPVSFRIVGLISSDLGPWLDSLGAAVERGGYQEHPAVVRELRSAGALLLTAQRRDADGATYPGTSAKLFEYLASGRPIAVIGPEDSEAVEIVRANEAGVWAPLDAERIAERLAELARRWGDGRLPPGCSREQVAPYTRRHLTGQLANVLNAITAPAARGLPAREARVLVTASLGG